MGAPGASGKLDGAAIGKLTDLIASAFKDDELERLVRTNMDVGLYNELVEPNQKRKTLVFKLLEAMEQRGTAEQFLRAVLEARPARSDLREFIGAYCSRTLEASQSQAKGGTKSGFANIQVTVGEGGVVQGVGAAENVNIGNLSFGSPPKPEKN